MGLRIARLRILQTNRGRAPRTPNFDPSRFVTPWLSRVVQTNASVPCHPVSDTQRMAFLSSDLQYYCL